MLKKVTISPYAFPGLKLTIGDKRKILEETRTNRVKLSKEDILDIISKESGVGIHEIVSRSRKKEIVNARFIFCSIMKDYYDYSLVHIGEMAGGRDHTSVIHAIEQHRSRVKNEDSYRNLTSIIYEKISLKIK
jgi:chromosomal replication initiator protein